VLTISTLWLQRLPTPPEAFPINATFTIAPGSSLPGIAAALYEGQYIRSELLFYLLMHWYFDPRSIKASTYRFTEPLTMHQIGERITRGEYSADLVRITLIEGERASVFANRVATTLPEFNATEFVALAEPVEGTLFPETYFVPPDYTATDLFTLLTTTYEERIAPLRTQFDAHQLDERGVITLASIVEREANTPESKKLVAGILLSRLSIGMPLQADASIEYVLDKPLGELTPADLDRDTPYNTYLYRGLPPTPIGNPGLTAIDAVLNPTESPYLFYITGNDGNFYYAETYDEHQRNIARHLR
jgi:UPF0755 protein